jgi:hypothetical protein
MRPQDGAQITTFEWANQTTLHPVSLVVLAAACIATLAVRRRYALVPLLVIVCFITRWQNISVAGLDFPLERVTILVAWLRVFLRGEARALRWCAIDSAVLAWAITATVAFIALWHSWAAAVYRAGWCFDGLGAYFVFRILLRDAADVRGTVVTFLVLSLPTAAVFLWERLTGNNPFAVFGQVETLMREGKLRCVGPFGHPILAGCFWAGTVPVFAVLWWARSGESLWALLGVAAAGTIVLCTGSSTPVMALLGAGIGLAAFPVRRHMWLVRWSLFLGAVLLHLVMTAPVWHLLARIDLVGGSTGWHRYNLVDQAINNFADWWLMGTKDTANWGYYTFDVTNDYIVQGIRGGVFTLLLQLIIIALAFRAVGTILRASPRRPDKLLAWALGVCVFQHALNFVAVGYFGKIVILWFLHLASIQSLQEAVADQRGAAAADELRRRAIGGFAAQS